eukprot:scaffold1762_cov417-Pavlova_lutheri.AAC.1
MRSTRAFDLAQGYEAGRRHKREKANILGKKENEEGLHGRTELYAHIGKTSWTATGDLSQTI